MNARVRRHEACAVDGEARLLRGPGRAANRERRRAQGRVPQARHAAPSGPQSGRQDCEHRFKEINEAYDVLKDGDKRAAYDRFGHAAFEHGRAAASGGFGADFASTFCRHFRGPVRHGAAGARGARRRAASAAPTCATTWRSARGSLHRQDRAGPHPDRGRPARPVPAPAPRPARKPKTCATCGGQGRIRHAQGFFTLERTCPACQGRGQVIEDPCPSCAGVGPRDPRAHARRSTFRPASRTARASGSPAKARPACAAARPATSTFSCRSSRTNSSSATAPICIAACRSRW